MINQSDRLLRGLSLIQPYATLIAIGAKRIETRSWSTDYRGLVAIHASKTWNRGLSQICQEEPFRSTLRRVAREDGVNFLKLPLGAIVAVAHLHRVGRISRRRDGRIYVTGRDLPVSGDELDFGNYEPGLYAWVFTNVQRLPEPIPCRGAPGLWPLPPEVESAMLSQERET